MSINLSHEENDKNVRFARIRRLKKFLRHLPRRSNIHQYPFLKYFSGLTKKRPYLWSVKPENILPAIYAGSVLTILPLQGIQVPCSLALCLLFKANLPLTVGLQFISNPFTLPPIYAADYYVGDFFLRFFTDPQAKPDDIESIATMAANLEETLDVPSVATSSSWIIDMAHKCVEILIDKGPYFFAAACVGGFVLGLLLGVILHIAYRVLIHPKSQA